MKVDIEQGREKNRISWLWIFKENIAQKRWETPKTNNLSLHSHIITLRNGETTSKPVVLKAWSRTLRGP